MSQTRISPEILEKEATDEFSDDVQLAKMSSIVRPRKREGGGRGATDTLAGASVELAVAPDAVVEAAAAGLKLGVALDAAPEAAGASPLFFAPKREVGAVVEVDEAASPSFFSALVCVPPKVKPPAAGLAGSSFFSAGLPKEKPGVGWEEVGAAVVVGVLVSEELLLSAPKPSVAGAGVVVVVVEVGGAELPKREAAGVLVEAGAAEVVAAAGSDLAALLPAGVVDEAEPNEKPPEGLAAPDPAVEPKRLPLPPPPKLPNPDPDPLG